MRIKRFSHRFKQYHRLVVIIMIMTTTSLLGVSYGYWSDESTIKAQIKIPEIKFKVVGSKVIQIFQADLEAGMKTITINVEKENTSDGSSIQLKYDSYEIYYKSHSQSGEQLLAKKDMVGESNHGIYQPKINLDTSVFKSLLSTAEQSDKKNNEKLKIKLNFKQDVPSGSKGWEYSIEEEYEIEFIGIQRDDKIKNNMGLVSIPPMPAEPTAKEELVPTEPILAEPSTGEAIPTEAAKGEAIPAEPVAGEPISIAPVPSELATEELVPVESISTEPISTEPGLKE